MSNKSEKFKRCRQALQRDWYIQGFNGLPIFLTHVGVSANYIKEILGYEYEMLFLDADNGYAEFGYLWSDLEGIWKIVREKLATNEHYLREVKKDYFARAKSHERFFAEITTKKLQQLSDKELIEKFKKGASLCTDSVNSSHILEAVGIGLEKDFAEKLGKFVKNKKECRQYSNVLTAPTEPSFFAQEKADLEKIADLGESKRSEALKKHTQKYFWITNSYAKIVDLSVDYFSRQLEGLGSHLKEDEQATDIKEKKWQLIKKFNLDNDTIKDIALIDFSTAWQDERKVVILKTIGYFNRIIREVARRTDIALENLYNVGLEESVSIKSLSDVKELEPELSCRHQGVFFLMDGRKTYTLSGDDYQRIHKYRKSVKVKESSEECKLQGSVAMTGTARGRAIICKGLESLEKVEEGDVVITSMTRPEFLPALKKAAAIVTDEGGVTCHAAIVARELGIPTIIGTKTATHIFKDGMQVEVHADDGVVREIK